MSSSRDSHCYICNDAAGLSLWNSVSLLHPSNDLQSGKPLRAVISQILDKPVQEVNLHSTVICNKCHKTCTEYDDMQTRLAQIKTDLISQFKVTLRKHNLNYNSNDEFFCDILTNIKSEPLPTDNSYRETKKLVLPASKLKPLPPNYVILNRGNINMGKLANLSTSNNVFKLNPTTNIQPKTIIKKISVANSILTQTLSTTCASMITKHTAPIKLSSARKTVTSTSNTNLVSSSLPNLITHSVFNASAVTSILDAKHTSSFDLSVKDLLPKDFLTSPNKSNSELEKELDKNDDLIEVINDLENTEEQPMEIDEECSLVPVVDKNVEGQDCFNEILTDKKDEFEKANQSQKQSLVNISLLPTLEVEAGRCVGVQGGGLANTMGRKDHDQFVIGKVEIMQDDNDLVGDEQAILMEEDENGSLIRMVSGQKFVYNDREISLIIPQAGSENDSSEEHDKNDPQDSNDESQIELQVSGDEETANAIIEAAQKQGGAYIKVESGEMYRVETVEKEKTSLVDNSQYIVEKVGDSYKCLLCDNIKNGEGGMVGTAGAVTRHARTQHGARVYICTTCGRILRRRSEFTQHIAMHADETALRRGVVADKTKQYGCHICLKKFSSQNILSEHMNIHSGSRPYSCSKCCKTFASKYTHQAHMKIHQNRPRPHKCYECGKTFFTQQNLTQHEKTHSGIKDFVCKICDKAFATQHNLEVHGVVHSGHKPYVCGVCEKAFARRAEIKDHMRTHTGERPFSCELCGATFSQRSNLQSHKRATHFNDKRHACPHCDKRFKRRRLLDYHIKASHTGERPFACEVCKSTFVYPEHYKKHMRIHSGEKPYQCEICGKTFNSRDNRNSHRFIHSDKKPYECVICSAGFMRKPLLYIHMNNTGHLSETIVVNQPRIVNTDEIDENETTQSVNVKNENSIFIENNYLESIEESELEAEQRNDNSLVETDRQTKVLLTADRRIILQDAGGEQVYTINFEDTSEAARQMFAADALSGKITLDLVADTDESNLIALGDNLIAVGDQSGSVATSVAGADTNIQILGKSESGAIVRLLPMQISGGGEGWVAINP